MPICANLKKSVTAQPTMIRGIRGAEAACSVHESPFGADD